VSIWEWSVSLGETVVFCRSLFLVTTQIGELRSSVVREKEAIRTYICNSCQTPIAAVFSHPYVHKYLHMYIDR